MNGLAYKNITPNFFKGLGQRDDLIKFSWHIYSHFCKLDHFIDIRNICFISMKWSSLQKRVTKFAPKEFYEIDPRLRLHSNTRLARTKNLGRCNKPSNGNDEAKKFYKMATSWLVNASGTISAHTGKSGSTDFKNSSILAARFNLK